VNDDNRLEVGELLAKIACANCHALEPGAPLHSIPDKFHGAVDRDLIAAFIDGPLRHGAVPYMPRIALPRSEVDAIAAYIGHINLNRPDARQPGADPQAEKLSAAQPE